VAVFIRRSAGVPAGRLATIAARPLPVIPPIRQCGARTP
jgi:hypothetical protein